MRSIGAVAALIILTAMAATGASGENEAAPERTQIGEFVPSSQPTVAPEIRLTDAAGETVALADFQGKLVLINLWATWCEPCLREMPSLERLQSRLGDRITVLAVSEDRGGSKIVDPFIAKLGLKSVKTYLDPKSAVGQAFGVRGLPTSLLVDREGKVLGRVEGAAEWDSPKMLGVLEPFVAGGGIVKSSSY